MTPDVDRANGWEGGHVVGREAVRDYWRRQWTVIDSTAEPTAVTERPDVLVCPVVVSQGARLFPDTGPDLGSTWSSREPSRRA